MKRVFMLLATSVAVILSFASCKKEVENLSIEVEGIEGIQSFLYGETREFPFTSENVSKTSFDKPVGWEARMDFKSKMILISAPSPTDATAEESGTVKINVSSASGQTKSVSIAVAARDADIRFSLEGISDGIVLKYGESLELKSSMSNVASIEVSGVKGWKADKVSESAVKVTAPSKGDAEADLTGTIVLTPKSGRGNAGQPVSFNVEVKVAEPSVQLETNEVSRVDFGTVTVINTTEFTNVETLDVKSAPKGWNISVDKTASSARISVSAPVQGSDMDGMGTIVLVATSESGATCEVSVAVSMKGINSAEDLLACADEWNKGDTRDMSAYTLGGEIALNTDVDISATVKAIVFTKDFTSVFNGYNHTITYALEAETSHLALFQTVATPGTVKNLTVAGTMLAKTEAVDKQACIAAWSDGGTFENIIVKVDYTQLGGSPKGYFGGITGDQTNKNGGGIYRNCHFRGSINVQTTRFLGGIIGDVWDNVPDADKGLLENCSNEGSINVTTLGTRINNAYHGGLVGKCDGSHLKFVNCVNSCNMLYDFGGAKSDIEAIGGIAGKASGTFTGCHNSGNIVFKNDNVVVGWAHAGGFIGWAASTKSDSFTVKSCYNTGNVNAYGEDIASFIAYIRDFAAGQCLISDCYSEGSVDCVFSVSTMYIGGFVSTVYNNAEFRGCRFSGKTRGYAKVTGASFVGRACDAVIIDNCESSGIVCIGCHTDVTDAVLPLTSGFVNVYRPQAVITNSKVKGNVYHMGPADSSADKILCSAKVAQGTPSDETSTVDDATRESAAAVTVTRIAKTDAFPSDWK